MSDLLKLTVFCGLFSTLIGCGDAGLDDSGGAGASSGSGGATGGATSAGTAGSDGAGASSGSGGAGGELPMKRRGHVRLEGHRLVDDTGPFQALGASLMWGAWGFKNDQPRLRQNLEFLSKNGFHYIRVLGVVGDPAHPDYWDGREVDANWPDYDQVIAGLTDMAYDEYGLRVEWTLIGDGQLTVPSEPERYALIDRFLSMSATRQEKIMHFEIANEAWQNGFAGTEGILQLRTLTRYMNDRTDLLVAASAPSGPECSDTLDIYAGGVADLATIHFDRDVSRVEGSWRPVRQPWEHVYCEGAPVGSNNEPIGPGASVASEDDPEKLVAAAIATYVSNLPMYVFHTDAGVRGMTDLFDAPGADAFRNLAAVVPNDLSNWSRRNAHWSDSPFVVFAGENGQLYPNEMWVDRGAPESGVVRAYGSVQGDDFFVFPIGILNHAEMEARRNMRFDVIDPMSGAVLATHDLDAGERVTLQGRNALVLKGRFLP